MIHTGQRHLLRTILLSAGLLIAGIGCGDDATTDPDTARDIPETDLFPFALGRKLVYNEYLLDSLTSQKVPGSDHRRTIHADAGVTRNGKNAFLLLDSIYTPDGQLAEVESTFTAVENGNLYLEFQEGWRLAFDRSKRTNTRYAVGTLVDQSLGFVIAVPVDATIRNPESITTPAGSFQAYKLELVGRVDLGGTIVESPRHYYFAAGVGIVRYVVPVTPDPQTGINASGTEMVLVEKNF